MTLADQIKAVFQDEGVQEIIIRVSRYDTDGAAAIQAVVKRRDAPSGPWGVGVRTDASSALQAALEASRSKAAPIGKGDIFA